MATNDKWDPKVEKDQIFLVTGNTVVDALRLLTSGLKQPGQHNGPIIATLHRRESFGKQMTKAMNELKELSNIVSNEIIFIL